MTLVNFAMFDLVGLQLSPRMWDLGKTTLGRFGTKADTEASWPLAGKLLAHRFNLD